MDVREEGGGCEVEERGGGMWKGCEVEEEEVKGRGGMWKGCEGKGRR